MSDEIGPLELARRAVSLPIHKLWLRYFALGGMSTALEIEAYLLGALVPSAHEHDMIAVALNERFMELGRCPPIPYRSDNTQ